MKIPIAKYVDFKSTGSLAAEGQFLPNPLTTAVDEVFEPFRLELFPGQNPDGSYDTIRFLSLRINGAELQFIKPREFMIPAFQGQQAVHALDLGNPVLGGADYIGDPVHTATPKVGPRKSMGIILQNDDVVIDRDFVVRVWYYRFQGTDAELREALRLSQWMQLNGFEPITLDGVPAAVQQWTLVNPHKDEAQRFTKVVPLNMANFDTLAGGPGQDKPRIWRWMTWSENTAATTTNQFYTFDQGQGRAPFDFTDLAFNFDEEQAALIEHLAVQPGANLANTRVNINSRGSQDEQLLFTTPNDDRNQLPAPLPTDGTVRRASMLPVAMPKPQLIWNDKGGVEILDDGTPVAADAMSVGVYGWRFELGSQTVVQPGPVPVPVAQATAQA